MSPLFSYRTPQELGFNPLLVLSAVLSARVFSPTLELQLVQYISGLPSFANQAHVPFLVQSRSPPLITGQFSRSIWLLTQPFFLMSSSLGSLFLKPRSCVPGCTCPFFFPLLSSSFPPYVVFFESACARGKFDFFPFAPFYAPPPLSKDPMVYIQLDPPSFKKVGFSESAPALSEFFFPSVLIAGTLAALLLIFL